MILLIAAFAVILYFVEKYSLKHVLDKVTFETAADKGVVEPEEAFSWSITIRNGKRMMVPYLRLRENIPEGLLFADGSGPVGSTRFSWLTSTLYLGRRQKVCLSRDVMLPKRGRYFFHGAFVEAGDFLGIRSVTENYPELKDVVVKPRRSDSPELAVLLGGYLGEHSVRKSLMEDPINTISFLDYTGREPMRSISWIQSARHNRLLVKQYDHTAEFSCTVLLNVDCPSSRNRSERLEQCFSIVRSVCEELEKRKISCDFRTNGSIAGAIGSWDHVGDGLGAAHLETILEGLGRMTYSYRESAGTFLEQEIRGMQRGKSIILVTPVAPEEDPVVRTAAARLEKMSQRKVLVLYAVNAAGGFEAKSETAGDSQAWAD
ncbi:MAG: DUF58 domain-containing protein [Lachnospiraceae bacterium]|nr:DUF58 domain-containing protein [Lachnospiraceae bacterium]